MRRAGGGRPRVDGRKRRWRRAGRARPAGCGRWAGRRAPRPAGCGDPADAGGKPAGRVDVGRCARAGNGPGARDACRCGGGPGGRHGVPHPGRARGAGAGSGGTPVGPPRSASRHPPHPGPPGWRTHAAHRRRGAPVGIRGPRSRCHRAVLVACVAGPPAHRAATPHVAVGRGRLAGRSCRGTRCPAAVGACQCRRRAVGGPGGDGEWHGARRRRGAVTACQDGNARLRPMAPAGGKWPERGRDRDRRGRRARGGGRPAPWPHRRGGAGHAGLLPGLRWRCIGDAGRADGGHRRGSRPPGRAPCAVECAGAVPGGDAGPRPAEHR